MSLRRWSQKCHGITSQPGLPFVQLFADDQVIIAQDIEDAEYMLRKLVEEYMKWGLQINFGKTEYLTLDPGAGILTETGQIKAVNKFKYLGSILEATSATILEREKRISEGRGVIGMLNSVLWSKTILHKTKKRMYQALVQSILLKHTTGEQITGN
jgi:hypothetical protein